MIIDLVQWNPQSGPTIYAWKFPSINLSTYTQLIVRESQEAVLFTKGQIAGKFGPGKHTLNTENLPVLRKLFGLPFGGQNPFTAEVWFINKLQPYNLDWSVGRMDIHDPDYNVGIPLSASGRYGLRIADAERFLLKIVGTKSVFTEKDLTEQFTGECTTSTKSVLMQFMLANKIGLKEISAHLDKISEHLKSAMLPFWENLGFELTKFYVTTVEVDQSTEVGRRVLDAISRESAQRIAGYTWQQEKALDIAGDAVKNIGRGDTGILGAMLAMNMMGGVQPGAGGGQLLSPAYQQPSFAPKQHGAVSEPRMVREVWCSNCSKKFSSALKFCPHCGDSYDGCPKCGTDNDKDAKRCVSCGLELGGAAAGACPQCQAPLAPGSAFCGSCGKALTSDGCPRCGAALSAGVKFCGSCGQKLK